MTFSESVRTCLRKYADFSGRAGRAEFWYFYLFGFLVSIPAGIIDEITGLDFGGGSGDGMPVVVDVLVGGGVLGIVVSLALFMPELAVNVRRLHDIGRSGWWVLIVLVPCVGLIVMLVFCVTRGDPHPNDYGDRPDLVPGR